MALYTKLTKNQIAKLVAPFGLPAPQKIRGVLEGTVNTYYELTYPKKSYFLRVDEVASLKRLKNELKVFHLLEKIQKKLSFQTTLPLKNNKGKEYIPFGRKYVLLFEKIKGASYFHHRLKTKHLKQIGVGLGEIHKFSHTSGKKRLILQPHRFYFPELNRVYKQIQTKLRKKHPSVDLEIKQWMKWLKKTNPVGARQAAPLPSGLIHADLFPENLLFLKDKLQGILDFEAAGLGPFLFDIAVTLHACCHDGREFSLPKCRSFLKGYQKIRNLTGEEKKWLEYTLFQSTMRFLLTRLRDFELKDGVVMAEPFKDYQEYLRRFSEIPALTKRLLP